MRKLSLALAVGALVTAPVAAQSITTLFTSNNGGGVGWTVFFDLNVKVPLYLTSFDLNVGDVANTLITIDLYTTPSSYLGKEMTPAAWTKMSTGAGIAIGRDMRSPIEIDDLFMVPGAYGICIHYATCTPVYTNGTGSNQNYTNNEVDLSCGASTGGFFSGLLFTPRVWNGTIYYASPGQATYGTYGRGCAGTNGVVKLAAASSSLPHIGQSLILDVTQGPVTPTAGFMTLGFDKHNFGGGPLPFDLGIVGMPGCTLYLNPTFTFGIAVVNSKSSFTLSIPNDPTLFLLAFQNQAFLVDQGANALGLSSSNGGEGVIGK